MKRLLYLFIGLSTLAISCGKEDQAEIDRDTILQFIADNNLNALEDESGLYYVIDVPGGSDKPLLSDSVTIDYRGFLTNGSVFDQTVDNQPRTFLLNDLIEGWKIGIPKFGREGSGTLLVPSRLGYGDRQVGSIPRNSVLIFDITLRDF
jgi:FKBP-type peptidyl-prolyl cis-trans isomerase